MGSWAGRDSEATVVCGETPRSRRSVRLRLYVMEAAAQKPQSLIDADVLRFKLSTNIHHFELSHENRKQASSRYQKCRFPKFRWDMIVFPEHWLDIAEGRPRCILGNLHAVLQPCINSKLLIGKCLKLWILFQKGVCSFKCCSDI